MLKGLVTAASTAALLVASASPAFADPTQFYATHSPAADAPRGVSLMAGIRMPLGKVPAKTAPVTFGLTAGYGMETAAPGYEGRERVRMMKFGDLRFSANGVERAELATFDLANLEDDPRFNIFGNAGNGNGIFIVGGVIIGGLLICWAAGCFDDGEDSDESPSPTPLS